MSLGGLAPLPSDALVTPVTFRVKRRRLRGILSDLDAKETGQRELSGEWVMSKKTYQRLKETAAPEACKKSEMVVMYIHGGALTGVGFQILHSVDCDKQVPTSLEVPPLSASSPFLWLCIPILAYSLSITDSLPRVLSRVHSMIVFMDT